MARSAEAANQDAPTDSDGFLRSGILGLALVPCLAGALLVHGWNSLALLLGVCLAVGLLTAYGFARAAGRPVIPGAGAAATLFALSLPAEVPLLPAALSLLFGQVLGREIFGTRARSFVHPAVLGGVFLLLTWPTALPRLEVLQWQGQAPTWALFLGPGGAGPLGSASAAACGLGAAVLLLIRPAAWRTWLALPLGLALGVALLGPRSALGVPFWGHLLLGGTSFAVVFLATDPHASTISPAGRWFSGALLGFLIVLFRTSSTSQPEGTMSALLLVSVLAPLIDHVARSGRNRWRARDV